MKRVSSGVRNWQVRIYECELVSEPPGSPTPFGRYRCFKKLRNITSAAVGRYNTQAAVSHCCWCRCECSASYVWCHVCPPLRTDESPKRRREAAVVATAPPLLCPASHTLLPALSCRQMRPRRLSLGPPGFSPGIFQICGFIFRYIGGRQQQWLRW